MVFIAMTVNLILLAVVLINWIKWRPMPPLFNQSEPRVSVLIPARNEEKNIAAAVRSALDQGSIVEEILIYDDHSDDQTRPIVCALHNEVQSERAPACPSCRSPSLCEASRDTRQQAAIAR